ncbi:uncharacterized protein Z520_04992 [Fonsecaea multimorphosa CBS 102226]|uniref:Uncharacterized protein n=1 Tax=Fonsecaea multimorphosa CBS 102226 TaxID=1442371 RepID=A0A0D2IR26_9EURO|nr:uncharacterized protein Z520_04992 [Fonsecaea multimorphosa CBS 102226]KIX99416.1 hypothetical protein Z520_04992 [Fonsecaea multimorphosa CBS 102226]OAL25744.1 hypothetical protein AYO22_04733 [Fonsecaea multimorphosa]
MTLTSVDYGTGLMANWANIDPSYLVKYQQWLNCEHMPERVSIPGFLQGRRYRLMDNTLHFLAFYETETTSVLGSAAYLQRLNSPTPWTLEALGAFQGNPVRNIYTRIADAGRPGLFTAPYVISVRFNLPEGREAVYVARWVKETAQHDRVDRVRLYKQDSAIGNIQTSERKIYGAGPGEQLYLLLIECSKPPGSLGELFQAWDAPLGPEAQRNNELIGAYWLEMAHAAWNK